jgi:hypothetical protein
VSTWAVITHFAVAVMATNDDAERKISSVGDSSVTGCEERDAEAGGLADARLAGRGTSFTWDRTFL